MNGFYLSYPETRSKSGLVDLIEFILKFAVEAIVELLFGAL
jgi:hypothetical protein